MDDREYTLEKISYSKKEDCRIIESVLNGWFQNPKTLNLVSPNLTYPFKFKDWVSKHYFKSSKPITSIVIKSKNWIVGHISYRIEKNKVHLFHLIIDKNHREKGFAKKLIDHVEKKLVTENNINCITLNCVKKNEPAINLYQSIGYNIIKEKKYLKMNKYF